MIQGAFVGQRVEAGRNAGTERRILLIFSVMAVVALQVAKIPAWVMEWPAVCVKFLELGSAALREDDMARVAVTGLDDLRLISRLVLSIVAAKTPKPVFVTDVVGINLPVRLHFGEKISRVH